MIAKMQTVIIIVVLVLVVGCHRDGPLTDDSIEKISSELDVMTPSLMKENNIEGLSLVVIRGGNVSISKSYGYSAWSLFTTVSDYARFVSFTIEQSCVRGSVAEEMLKPQVSVDRNVKWGIGWGLQDTVPGYSFWHWGSMVGFRYYIVGYPKEKVGVIVMTNSSSAFKIVDDIVAKAIGGSYPSYDWF